MKLTMDALKERADAVASEELLLTISGGTENACHDTLPGSEDWFVPPTGSPGASANFLSSLWNLYHILTE